MSVCQYQPIPTDNRARTKASNIERLLKALRLDDEHGCLADAIYIKSRSLRRWGRLYLLCIGIRESVEEQKQ